jgi:hypothetical protein
MVEIDPELLTLLTPEEMAEFDKLLMPARQLWTPLPGPQTAAFLTEASILGYGGAAGGGKSDLGMGLGCTQHLRTGIFRQNGTELTAIVDRLAEIVGSRDGLSEQKGIWRLERPDGVPIQIELGSFPRPGDERKYQGRPHDLLVFDEAQNMRQSAVRYILGWLRSTVEGQRCRAVFTFNPPTDAIGQWIIQFFGPWLDKAHRNPAEPGELRWFTTIDGVDAEVESGDSFEHNGEIVRPRSRTFIPSRVSDNPYLAGTEYEAELQAMPEPWRSQMLHGDFEAGMEDDPWQVIPTDWVDAAMARWERPPKLAEMDSLGVDVAMGGRDQTIIARRHGMWFDEPIVYNGRDCPDGPTIAGYVVAASRNEAVIHIDLFGVGAKPYGHLMGMQQRVIGVNVGDPAPGTDSSGRLRFKNLRSLLWWRMREALDPSSNSGIALPRDRRLRADLCAATWKPLGPIVQVASSEDMTKEIGRSPDFGTAYVLGLMNTPKIKREWTIAERRKRRREYDPFEGY